ncbi:HD domain-containing phosphohydrolase [Bacteroidota bacterium]
MTLSNGEFPKVQASAELDEQEAQSRLALLCEVGKKIGEAAQLTPLVEQIMQMTQRALNASASSVILLDEYDGELFFQVAEGPAGKQLRQARLNAQTGIAGWVAHHATPLVINDVTKDERFDNRLDIATGFVTRSIMCAPMIVQRKVIGVIEVLNKLDDCDFSESDLEALVSVAATAAMSIENIRLHQSVIAAYKSTIKALAATIDAKDPYTCGHSQRVTEYALRGAEALSLPAEDHEMLEYAGILHDIGKVGIAENILTHCGSLNTKEWEIVREHPKIGADILKEIPFLAKVKKLVLHHHERYDGNGYPDGLKGKDIPIEARLLAVADAYEAMTSLRPYRERTLTQDEAIKELEKNKGTQFDPEIVVAFINTVKSNSRLEAK